MKKLLLVGGHGGRSGVPKYIENLFSGLDGIYEINVAADENLGGYNTIPESRLHEVVGLSSQSGMKRKINAIFSLYKVIKSLNPDVVWANSSFSVLFCRLLSIFISFQLVVTYHGVPFGPGRSGFISRFAKAVEKVMFNFSNEVTIAISQKDLTLLQQLSSKKAIKHIPNSIKLVKSHLKTSHLSGMYKIVMTTRDSYQKNLDYAAKILSTTKDAQLTVFGSVSDNRRKELNRLAGRSIEFKGEVADVQSYLKKYDCYLMTSRYEGFSLGMLEAISVGLAVASTDVGGIEEVADGNPYLKVLGWDSDEAYLDEFLFEYRDDPGSIYKVQQAFAKYEYKKWLDKNCKVLENVCIR